jgi:hypothetical protein
VATTTAEGTERALTSAGGSAVRMSPRHAAERAARHNSINIRLPIVGELEMPAKEELAFIGGVVALAVVGILEWPVAALLCIGHKLATSRHNKIIREFGEALEEA